jgi:MarR family transcriptional regulator for hemolysin
MGSWFDTPDFKPLGRQLSLAHRGVHAELDARLAERGASLWNWVLLREAALANGASQRELAERMGIEPPTLVSQLDRLVADGYVERQRDVDDRRVIRISVTPLGKRRLTELHKIARTFDTEMRSLFTERELETVSKMLTRLFEQYPISRREEPV